MKKYHNVSVIALGDYYSDMWIWNTDENTALENAADTAVAMLNNSTSLAKEDIISRAWQYLNEWCVANYKSFDDDVPVRYGFKEEAGQYYVLKFAFDDALKRKNYPVEKCMTGFFERGYMHLNGNRRQVQRRYAGKIYRYYVVAVEITNDDISPLR